MDEPFGALDAQTRIVMGEELVHIWEETRKTVIFVTHSVEEAIYLGTKVVVMTASPGRIKSIESINLSRHETTRRMNLINEAQASWNGRGRGDENFESYLQKKLVIIYLLRY